jgi:hypothetical protein
MKVGANENGMSIKMLLPFRMWHPPLLIPWDSIVIISEHDPTLTKNGDFSKIKSFFKVKHIEVDFKSILTLRSKYLKKLTIHHQFPNLLRCGFDRCWTSVEMKE